MESKYINRYNTFCRSVKSWRNTIKNKLDIAFSLNFY